MRQVKKIVVHCSDTFDSPGVSWDDIERFHTSHSYRGRIITPERAIVLAGQGETVRHPWQDIGYHAGIEYVGTGGFLCLYGRPLHIAGAHCRRHNADSLGFMFCGDYDESPPPREMLITAARRVLAPWCVVFGLKSNDIHAHRSFDSGKTCPGSEFDMDVLRTMVGNLIGG